MAKSLFFFFNFLVFRFREEEIGIHVTVLVTTNAKVLLKGPESTAQETGCKKKAGEGRKQQQTEAEPAGVWLKSAFKTEN